MEITRLAPYPLYANQDGLQPNQDYIVHIYDDHYQLLSDFPVTSDGNGSISIQLPEYYWRYDDEYRMEIAEITGYNGPDPIIGDTVVIDTMTIMRPYVDPTLLADTPEDLEEATMYEAIARAIINSITGGFMYQRNVFETVGVGNDYLAVPYRLNRIVEIVENDIESVSKDYNLEKYTKINFEDVQYVLKNSESNLLINTLPDTEQSCLLPKTVHASQEESLINKYLNNGLKNMKTLSMMIIEIQHHLTSYPNTIL